MLVDMRVAHTTNNDVVQSQTLGFMSRKQATDYKSAVVNLLYAIGYTFESVIVIDRITYYTYKLSDEISATIIYRYTYM